MGGGRRASGKKNDERATRTQAGKIKEERSKTHDKVHKRQEQTERVRAKRRS